MLEMCSKVFEHCLNAQKPPDMNWNDATKPEHALAVYADVSGPCHQRTFSQTPKTWNERRTSKHLRATQMNNIEALEWFEEHRYKQSSTEHRLDAITVSKSRDEIDYFLWTRRTRYFPRSKQGSVPCHSKFLALEQSPCALTFTTCYKAPWFALHTG